mgnify:CR=1 FL=1
MAKSNSDSKSGQIIEILWWRRSPRPVRVEVHIKKPGVKADGIIEEIHGWVPRKKIPTPHEDDRPHLYLQPNEDSR